MCLGTPLPLSALDLDQCVVLPTIALPERCDPSADMLRAPSRALSSRASLSLAHDCLACASTLASYCARATSTHLHDASVTDPHETQRVTLRNAARASARTSLLAPWHTLQAPSLPMHSINIHACSVRTASAVGAHASGRAVLLATLLPASGWCNAVRGSHGHRRHLDRSLQGVQHALRSRDARGALLRMSRLCSSNATPIADLRLLRSNALATGRVSSLRFVLCACARDAGSVAAGTRALVAVACQSCVHASQASAGAAAHQDVILSKPHRTGTSP